jgi:hypothetical protein
MLRLKDIGVRALDYGADPTSGGALALSKQLDRRPSEAQF